jgi:hypothetical protein
MYALKRTPNRSLTLFVGLLSSAIAACGGGGLDGLVTVGIRPIDGGAASAAPAASGADALPTPGSDVMNPMFEDDGTTGAFAPMQDECGEIPPRPAGKVTSGRVSGSGLIEYAVDDPNVFTGMRTTLAVPAEPPRKGTIFIWPGLQPTPHGVNLMPIGNGALLTVLSWGPSACPSDTPASYSTWWIAPMYSNISTSDPRYSGCHSGQVMVTAPGHLLDVDTHIEGTTWVQTVVDRDSMETSDFSLSLNGQAQGRVFFDIQLATSNKPTEDIVFTNTVLSMDMSDPDACQPIMRGTNDFASQPRVSTDGKHCCIDRIVLRAAGVVATTLDPP